MSKLVMSLDGQVIREFELEKEHFTIGRKPHHDIHIDNIAVSGDHAGIRVAGNDAVLEDSGSTNGTLVNGTPITRHILQNGDIIEIGKYKLKFVAGQSAIPAEDFEKTMIIRRPPAAKPADAPRSVDDTIPGMKPVQNPAPPAAPAAPATAPAAAVKILSGSQTGKELVLTKSLTSLGKPGVQVAVISRRPQGYFITHVQGASFPAVNAKPLDEKAYALSNHDIIELAGIRMEFYFKD